MYKKRNKISRKVSISPLPADAFHTHDLGVWVFAYHVNLSAFHALCFPKETEEAFALYRLHHEEAITHLQRSAEVVFWVYTPVQVYPRIGDVYARKVLHYNAVTDNYRISRLALKLCDGARL